MQCETPSWRPDCSHGGSEGEDLSMTAAPSALPVEELILSLADAGSTGTLVVSTPRYRRRLFLVDGELAGVTSEDPREWLGHFMVGNGLVSEDQLQQALEGQEQLAVPLGTMFEKNGTVGRAAVTQALDEQAIEVVLGLFHGAPGERHFAEGTLPENHPLGLRIALPPLVLAGLRRRLRLRQIEERLEGLEVVPRRTSPHQPPRLSPKEERIFAAINGANDLAGIGLLCHLAPIHVADFVMRGVEAGFLAVAPQQQWLEPSSDFEILQHARRALADGSLKEVWDRIRPLRGRPTDRETFDQVEDLEVRLKEALAQRRIVGHLVPHALPIEDAQQLPPLEPEMAYTLSRVNGKWTLRQIQRIVPVEDLHFGVIVDALMRRGLIELRYRSGGTAVVEG